MKTENKETISRDLESLQSLLRKLERHEKKLITCETDTAEMQARIEKIGKPSYKNEAAHNELAALERRLKLCQDEATEAATELPALRNSLAEQLHPISVRAMRLLKPLVERRVETITAAMKPFCDSEASAVQAAKGITDSATARMRHNEMNQLRIMQPDSIAAKIALGIDALQRERGLSQLDAYRLLQKEKPELFR